MEILSDAEMLRYNRQIILKQFDFEGQEALKRSSILVLVAGFHQIQGNGLIGIVN